MFNTDEYLLIHLNIEVDQKEDQTAPIWKPSWWFSSINNWWFSKSAFFDEISFFIFSSSSVRLAMFSVDFYGFSFLSTDK